MTLTEARENSAPLDPNALSLASAAELLAKASRQPITTAMLEQDVAAGAPTNADGTINLIHYAAWLVREMEGHV